MSEELLTKEQVMQTIEFADALYNIDKSGFYTPWLSNSNLVQLNNNARIPRLETIRKALSDYKNNESDLQAYTEFMKHYDMIFARVLKSYVGILSFDLQYTCSNIFTKDEYDSKEYLEDKKRVNKFLDGFDYKAEFRKVVEQVMTNEVGYYTFRHTQRGNKGIKGTLQLLPQKYCMLTGYWEKGLLADFDMRYFLQAGVDIDGFAPAFKQYFKNVFGNTDIFENYQPSNQFKERNGVYAMWTQTTPDDIWAFKFDLSNFAAVPFLAPYLSTALTDSELQALQYSKDIASAYAILAGEIRLFDNAKSGTKADQFAIDPKTLVSFMQRVKQGLPDEIKVVAMPTENSKFYQYTDNNKDMYATHLVSAAGVGSSLSRVIYSSDRMSNAELQYAAEAQGQIMKPLYAQFANFLEYFVNKVTKKYHFKFHFEGLDYEFDRQARFDRLMKLADKGIVMNESAFASVLGIPPQMFECSLRDSKYSGWVEKYSQLLLNVNTTSQNEGGRPKLNATEISDSGELNRDM